jgi:RNA polymerase sigma factor (TIGR02999 family)
MSGVTQILSALGQGDSVAAEQLLPLVYQELRQLAAQKLAHEKPGQTLRATALVHEAYLRLVGPADGDRWDSRGHFFAAAATAMRRILIERARHKQRIIHKLVTPAATFRRIEYRLDPFLPKDLS